MVHYRFGRLTLLAALLLAFIAVSPPSFAKDGAGDGKRGAFKKPLAIEASVMEVDNRGGKVVFRGDVEAREAFILCSDELHVHYNEAQEVSDIIAIGNVRLFQDGKVARAGRATYERADGTMVLTESPSISQCGNKVTGTKITFNVDSEIALIEGGKDGRVRAVIMPEKECSGEDGIEEDFCRRTR